MLSYLPPARRISRADDPLQAELERLRAKNTAFKGRAAKSLTLKVREKDAVSSECNSLQEIVKKGALSNSHDR